MDRLVPPGQPGQLELQGLTVPLEQLVCKDHRGSMVLTGR